MPNISTIEEVVQQACAIVSKYTILLINQFV